MKVTIFKPVEPGFQSRPNPGFGFGKKPGNPGYPGSGNPGLHSLVGSYAGKALLSTAFE